MKSCNDKIAEYNLEDRDLFKLWGIFFCHDKEEYQKIKLGCKIGKKDMISVQYNENKMYRTPWNDHRGQTLNNLGKHVGFRTQS